MKRKHTPKETLLAYCFDQIALHEQDRKGLSPHALHLRIDQIMKMQVLDHQTKDWLVCMAIGQCKQDPEYSQFLQELANTYKGKI